MNHYSLLLIDADETLFDFRKSETIALSQTLEAAGLDPEGPAKDTYHRINAELWRRLERGELGQAQLRVDRFRLTFEALGLMLEAKLYADLYVKKLAEASFLIDGAEELCRYLHKNYQLVILTNGIAEVQRGRLSLSPISALIDDMVISEEEGCAKPDPLIYQKAFDRLHFSDKSRALMIGDSLSSDIRGGLAFGIDTCWINWSGKANPGEICPRYEVSDFAGIKAIL